MKHCTDAELMAIMDGEGAREHLDACPHCRARYAELEGALREFSAIHRGGRRVAWWRYAAAACLLVAAGLWLMRSRPELPNAALTPGATRPMTQAEVCVALAQDDDRMAPREMAEQVFAQYGIRNPQPRAYEVDYLITPALGGAEDVRNLWPQPYGGSVWTARVKDALEDYLRKMVCNGRLELATAQEHIATDWIAAYQKYFRTEHPLVEHAGFVKDRPWE
jgi:hypothetical protein